MFPARICIGNKNKPPAMQVCPQKALASSKKTSSVIISAGSPTALIITKPVKENMKRRAENYILLHQGFCYNNSRCDN